MTCYPKRHFQFIILLLCIIVNLPLLASGETNADYQFKVDIIAPSMDTSSIVDVSEIDACTFESINISILDLNNTISSFTWFDSESNLLGTNNILIVEECSSDYFIVHIQDNSNSIIVDTLELNCNSIDIDIDPSQLPFNQDLLDYNSNEVIDLCIGEEFSINLLNQNPNQELQYRWFASTDFISEGENTSSPTFSPSKEGIFGVLLVTTNQFGCRRRDQFNFSVHAISDLEIVVTATDDQGNDITLETTEGIVLNCNSEVEYNLSSIGTSSTGEVLIEWRNRNDELIGNNPGIVVEPGLNELYSVTVSDIFGCSSTKKIEFFGEAANYVLTDQFSGDEIMNLDDDDVLETCLPFVNPNFGIDLNTNDDIDFLWSGDIVIGNSNTSNPTLAPPSPGTYQVRLQVTNQFGCVNEYDFDLFFFDDQQEQIINYTQECGSLSVLFEAPNTDFNYYSWEITDTNNNTVTFTAQSINIEYEEIGQYEIKLIPNDNVGCSLSETTRFIEVRNSNLEIGLETNYLECNEKTLIAQFSNSSASSDQDLNYEWQFSNGQSSFSESPIVEITDPGSFQVDLLISDNFDCEVNESLVFEIELLNTEGFQDSIFACYDNTSIELNPNGDLDLNYAWAPNDYFNDLSQSNPIVSLNESTTFEVSINQSFEDYSCTSNMQVHIIVAPEIISIVDIQGIEKESIARSEESVDVFLCDTNLDPFTLLAPFTENAIYRWYNEPSLVNESLISEDQNLEVDPTDNIFDSVFLQIELDGCLSNTFAVNFNYESIPELDIVSDYIPSSGCGPGTLQLIANEQVNSSAIISYLWVGPNGFTSDLQSPSLPVNGAENNGTYILNVSTKGGCISTHSLNVDEITPALLPNPNIEFLGDLCEGQELKISVDQEYPEEASYNWILPSSVNVSGQGTEQLIISSFVESEHFGNYSLQVTVDTCISSVDTLLLAPTSNIAITSSPLCPGSNLHLELFSSDGISFEWNGPNNFLSNEKSPWINNVSEVNNGEYTVQIQNPNGCIKTLSTIVDNILPSFAGGSVSVAGPICEGDALVFTSDIPAEFYEWISPLGLIHENQGPNALITSEPNITIESTSSAYIPGAWKVMVTDENGCTAISSPVDVGITEVSIAEIQGDDTVCEGETLKVFANTVEDADYRWFREDMDGNVNLVSNAQAYEIPNIGAGLYTLSLEVSKNGCPSELSTKSFLIANRPTASPQISFLPTDDCNIYDVVLSSNVDSNQTISFLWTGPNGFVSNEANPIITNASSTDLGIYKVELIDENNCSSIDYTIELTEFPETIIEPIIMTLGDGCVGNAIELIATEYTDPLATYTWTGPNGLITVATTDNSISIPSFMNSDAGNYSVTVELNDCIISSQDFKVEVLEQPEVNISTPTTSVCKGDRLIIESNASNSDTYLWNGPNEFSSTEENIEIIDIEEFNNGVYSLIVTAPSGCTVEDDILIDFIPENIENPQLITSNICNGESLILSTEFVGDNYTWVSPLGDPENLPQLNPLITTANFVVIDSEEFYYLEGFWKVIVTNNEGCEFTSDIKNVSFQQNTAPNIFANDQTCIGEDVVLSTDAVADSYEWTFETGSPDFSPIVLNTDTNVVIVIPDDEAYLEGAWTLNVSSNFGCITPSSTAFVQFTEIPSPMPSNTGPYCDNQNSVQLFSNTIPSADYAWYQGDPSTNGILVSNEQNPSFEIDTDLDTISYFLLISQNGCDAEQSVTEVVFSKELVIDVQSDVVLNDDCSVSELQLFSNASGTGPLNYRWIGPNNFSSTEPNPLLMSDGTGNLSGAYFLQVFDIHNCEINTTTFIDLQEGVMAPSISADDSQLCIGDALNISASGIFTGFDVSYVWTGPLGSSLDGSYPDVQTLLFDEVSINDAGSYTVQVLSDGCMSDLSETILIEVNEGPEIDGLNDINTCYDTNTSITFPLNITNGNDPLTFEWNGPNQFQSSAQNPVLTNLSVENEGTYSVIVSDQLGCASDTIQLNVSLEEIPSRPIISASFSGTLCEGEDVEISIDNFDPSLEYTWIFENGNIIVQNDSILTINEIQATEHNGSLSVFSVRGNCNSVDSEAITIDVKPKPEIVGISNSTEISPACYGETVQLIGPEIQGANYIWAGPNNFVSNAKDVLLENPTVHDTGLYTLVIQVDGCSSEPFETVVNIENRIAIPIINPIDVVCEGTDIALELLNANANLTYEWFTPESNQAIGTGNPLFLQNIGLESAGTYYVIASSTFCSSEASPLIIVEVESKAESTAYAGQDTIVCQPSFLLGRDSSQLVRGTWSFLGENNSASILNPDEYTSFVVDLKEGTNEFVWTLDEAMCMENAMDTISVHYLFPPTANDDAYTVGLNTEFMGDVTLNDILTTSNIAVSLVSQANMGTFELNDQGFSSYVADEDFIGIDSIEYLLCYDFCPNDCDMATAIFNIGEEFECFVPSVFTPNGDGLNDYFDIPFLSRFPQSTIYIYNRWGDEVYYSDNYQGEWQGSYKGNSLPAGTYYYRLEINDHEQNTKNGYVFIQR